MSICHVMEKPCEIFCDKKVNKSTLKSEKYERNFGINFNPNEKNDLLNFPSLDLDKFTGSFNTSDYVPEGTFDFTGGESLFGEEFSFGTNYFNTTEIKLHSLSLFGRSGKVFQFSKASSSR